jgi:enolase
MRACVRACMRVETADEGAHMSQGFVSEFPVVTIEDPFDQDDWAAYTKLTEMMSTTQIVGDDLLGPRPQQPLLACC